MNEVSPPPSDDLPARHPWEEPPADGWASSLPDLGKELGLFALSAALLFGALNAVHEARTDAHCVIHLHTDYGIAVSAQKDGLLPLSQQAMFALGSLAYHDYEGLALDEEEKPRLVADLGDKKFMILRNHGLLTLGRTAAEAFLGVFLLERACKIQILAQSGAGELAKIPNDIIDRVASQMSAVTMGQGASLTWPGLLRKLDRIDPSYRE